MGHPPGRGEHDLVRRHHRVASRVAIALVAVVALALAAHAKADIGRANLDGSGVDQSFIAAGDPCGVAVDGAHVYWRHGFGSNIGRANLDGSDADPNFITRASQRGGSACGVAVDGAHVYWTRGHPLAEFSIGRANLDGSGVERRFITAGVDHPCGVGVDATHVYWLNSWYTDRVFFEHPGSIGRANLDGSGADSPFIEAADANCGVAVDAAHLYWTNVQWNVQPQGVDTIGRAELDGGVVEQTFVPGVHRPSDVAVDSEHVYWASWTDRGSIGRANLDGSGADEAFITEIPRPTGVAVDSEHVYWASEFRAFTLSKVKRNRKRGTAKLAVEVTEAGTLKLASTKRVKGARKRAREADRVTLPIKPKGKARKGLEATGTTRVTAKVTFAPDSGQPSTARKRLRLVKR